MDFKFAGTIYYVNKTYINQQLLKVKILATCFSYNEPSSGKKENIVLIHSVPSSGQNQNYVLCSVFDLMAAHIS